MMDLMTNLNQKEILAMGTTGDGVSISTSGASNIGSTSVVEFRTPDLPPTKKKRIVLEEDKYALHLEKIIERDYFPDLEKLNAQNAYLNAMATNDIHMLRELYSKYSLGRSTPRTNKSNSGLETPSTFETPVDFQAKATPITESEARGSPTHLPMEERSTEDDANSAKSKKIKKSNEPSDMSLNEYLNSYTSEDNQSFQDFMEEAEKKHKIKYSWLYETEVEAAQRQIVSSVVPSIEQQADVYKRPLDIETWGYKTKNHVMYVPDGVEFSAAEEIELAKKKAKVIFDNTRFIKTPFKEAATTAHQSHEVSNKGILFRPSEGKIGVDGKEIEDSTPKVNGFSYVRTPSPTPGAVDDSPFMTWGEIEGTPFRLDAGDTPIPSVSSSKPYKIMEQSKRERLAFELAEKVSHRYRDKKLKAIQAAKSHLATPSPTGLKRGIEAINSMTPAAQRFAKSHFGTRIGSSDQALRSSYTPKRTTDGDGSVRSLLSTPSSTPTPGSLHGSKIMGTPSKEGRPATLITDDLLNLPKKSTRVIPGRHKAADYF